MTDAAPDRIILAFRPSDADYVRDAFMWTLYNPSLDNPYTVPDADEKINRAIEQFGPDDYERRDWEHWIRFDWQSVIDGDPERLEVEKPDWYDADD